MTDRYEWDRMMAQQLFDPTQVCDGSWDRIKAAQKAFNESEWWRDSTAFEALKQCFGRASDDMFLTPPVYFDHGDRVFFGEHFYANTGLTILDGNRVDFGDNVLLGPNVDIYTAGHPVDAAVRNAGVEYSRPVRIGNNVWIGGHVTINPGVTIGDDVVIGSGSVVVKDIPSHVIAVGNPCKPIRAITDDDAAEWQRQYREYRAGKHTHRE